jgi:hypothetical protein
MIVAFHMGKDSIHLDEWWGFQVSMDFHFFDPREVASVVEKSGFQIEKILEREPYLEVEHQSRRAYLFARRKP